MDSSQSSIDSHSVATVFVDRDGVVNEKMPEGRYVTSFDDFHLLPGSADAIARLNRARLRVIVVSNQRGISLGHYTAEDVNAIHSGFEQLIQNHGAHVDAFFYCPHDKRACHCRKPEPGMFFQAVAQFPAITAAESVMIGDSLSDIQSGRDLGMRTIFIEGDPNHRKAGGETAAELADIRCSSLSEAVDVLLSIDAPTSSGLRSTETKQT